MSHALPLSGRTVVVTRAAEQAGPFVRSLEDLGATVVELPLIRIIGPSDGGLALRDAITRLSDYAWVVFTSPNAADRFLREVGPDRNVPAIAAVGPGTAAVVHEFGFSVGLLADRSVGEGLVDSFPQGEGRVLVPQSMIGRPAVPDGLRVKGWTVDVVAAYTTEQLPGDPLLGPRVRAADSIAFTSSSTVDAFMSAYGTAALPGWVISIGPETTRTLADYGVTVVHTSNPHTLAGLIQTHMDALSN